MTTTTGAEQQIRSSHLIVTTAVTAASGLALVIVILLSLGDLPDRLATHFDLSGAADDTMSRALGLTMFLLVGLGLPALLLVVFARMQWWRGDEARRFAGFLGALPVGLSAVFIATVLANRGAASPDQVTLSPWVFAIALTAAVVAGLAVGLMVPRGVPRESSESVTPVALSPHERASWFGRVQAGPLVLLAFGAGIVALVIAAVTVGIWWLWLVVVGVALACAATTSFAVRVDSSGVTWRSALGLPRGHVPMSKITDAAVIDVSPADFGGFGIRLTPGVLGLVMRQGSALEVTHGKRRFVATVDDATTGAGLLLGYLQAGSRPDGTTRR
ncbi:DUF1648 domain-containing protein [Ornithinimicrobium cryptoxanthini]|uniref:DUF1648 domain-containing protein n=1 Tax=Ornithinimicrobium cryptoxanthini TaxID=2934161 RepID=A0ABY4YLR7_9MICO|nr:DUF1648 domain-containing protein [Ornithinimicrobium cryptoxanthini]USQ77511.1 DUF1648 domain-containing protein [Ornithinimicrobium cryptoxanthini]